MKTTEEKVLDVLVQMLDLESPPLRSARIIDDLGADSLAIVEITLSLEETFEMDIPDEAVDRCPTVGDAIDAIERELARKAQR